MTEDYGRFGPCQMTYADGMPCDLPSIGAIGGKPYSTAWGFSAFAYCSLMHRHAIAAELRHAGWEVKTDAVW